VNKNTRLLQLKRMRGQRVFPASIVRPEATTTDKWNAGGCYSPYGIGQGSGDV